MGNMIPDRYNKENLFRTVRDPSIAVNEAKRQVSHIGHIPRKVWFKQRYGSGIDVMNQDWDYLIILDACRYDSFEEVNDIDGKLKKVISRGSHSLEFCQKNFKGKKLHDTVYVTANGYGAQTSEGVFHDLIFTDDSQETSEVDILHSSSEGMAPETVYKTARNAYEKYPDKRLIIHFMQPHDPYYGPTAEELRKRVEKDGLKVISRDPKKIRKYDISNEKVISSLSGAAKKGYISNSELNEVYHENLSIVLRYVTKLSELLTGRVVITADHGELLGEHGIIGHPKYKYFKELREVPWLTIDSEARPDIVSEEPEGPIITDDDSIEKRLKALGYKEE